MNKIYQNQKTVLLSISILLFLTFSRCGGNASADKENVVPVELKDTTVLQEDEDKALEKLNNLIDTTKK